MCSDMWKPYLKVIAEKASQAVHVLDRFHVMQKMNKAIDEVRAGEVRQMKADGFEPVLKQSRWCLLKRRENLTEKQTVKLRDLLRYNLRSVRAYLLQEDFQQFWEYHAPGWAGQFPGRVVCADDAVEDRADEEDRALAAPASPTDPQLVCAGEGRFQPESSRD